MAEEHSHKTSSWVAVILMVLATVVLGLALIAWSVPLAILGAVVGLVGVGIAASFRIMDDAY